MDKNLARERCRVKSSYDFELSIKRENDVIYHYTHPKNKKLNGIVFIIAGFGGDTNSIYSQKLRDYVAYKFGVMAVSVVYHCFVSRLENGAKPFLDDFDEKKIIAALKHFNVKPKSDTVLEILNELDSEIQYQKNSGKLDKNAEVFLPVTLIPENDEYQNFGVLQALDHINVLKDIKSKNLSFIDNYPTILMGSSHGGYIANMVAKLTPNLIDCVIDNSSYIKPPLNFIIGKEDNYLNPENRLRLWENVVGHAFTKNMWSKDENSFYNFSKERYDIRDLSNKAHNELIAKKSNSKIKYISYHSVNDTLAPYTDKENLYKELNELGFDAELKTISETSEVDGNFIKSLEHGFDMSLKELANRELPDALKMKHDSSSNEIEPITFKCDSVNYNFEDINGVFSATLSPVENIEEVVVDRFKKNMEYFEKNQPELYSKLASLDSAVEQGAYQNRYELVFNNNFYNVKEYGTNNYLYADNSKRYAEDISRNFNKKVDKFMYFGVGLGVHLDKLAKKMQPKNALVVEDDLELFKLSTFVTSYYDLAKDVDLYFSVFDNEDSFSKIAKQFFSDLKEGEKTLNRFEINENYQNKILQLNNILNEL